MPRPRKCRRICEFPESKGFIPIGEHSDDMLNLTFDEFEVIRLLDFEKITQEQCAKQMDVARTTVTGIYEQARFKLADALLHQKTLLIQGGDVKACSKRETCCKKTCCHGCFRQEETEIF